MGQKLIICLSCLQFLLIFCIPVVIPSRILFLLPLSASSECASIHNLAEELLYKGHTITWVASVATETQHENYTEIIPIPPPEFHDYLGSENDSILTHRLRFKQLIPILLGWKLDATSARCHAVYNHQRFRDLVLKPAHKFDLIVINGNLHHCLLGLVVDTPYIVFHSIPFTGNEFRFWGIRMPPSFVPLSILELGNRMTFPQRLLNHLTVWGMSLTYDVIIGSRAEAVYRSHLGEHLPPISDIEGNVSLIFSNSHPVLSFPRPLTPDMIEVGCLQCRKAYPLPPGELKKWVDESDFGIVYFSMGTMYRLQTFPPQHLSAILNVLGGLKERVVFVGDVEEITTRANMSIPTNILVQSFVPQQDLLGHSKMKLFISHVGTQSHLEAGYHGVPLVVMPIYGDQALAAVHVQQVGTGILIEILELTEATFGDAVNKVLHDQKYRQKAEYISKMVRDQPQTSLERATFWTEYVLRHGGAQELRSSARDLNGFQYYGLDVVIFLVSFILSVTLIALKVSRIKSLGHGNSGKALLTICLIYMSIVWLT